MLADKYRDYMYGFVKKAIDEIGPRPACSEEERKLGRILIEEWRPVCSRIVTESFICSPDAFLGVIRLSVLLYLASILLYWFYPLAAFIMAVLSLLVLLLELVRYQEFVDFLFPRKVGQNITGTIPPRGEVKGRVIVSAHLDSAYEFRLWRLLGNAAVPLMALAVLGILMAIGASLARTIAYLVDTENAAAYTVIGIITISLSPVIVLFLFFHSNRAVPGAMDDLSGIAVLAGLAKYLNESNRSGSFYPQNTEIVLLATSSEEAGLRGAKRYVQRHLAELADIPTYAIFLESAADERHLTVATGELFTGAKHDPELVEMAREIAGGHNWPIKSRSIPLGASDASAFSRVGIPATCLLCQDTTRLVPNYHTREDMPGHIRPAALSVSLQMVIEMIWRIDRANE